MSDFSPFQPSGKSLGCTNRPVAPLPTPQLRLPPGNTSTSKRFSATWCSSHSWCSHWCVWKMQGSLLFCEYGSLWNCFCVGAQHSQQPRQTPRPGSFIFASQYRISFSARWEMFILEMDLPVTKGDIYQITDCFLAVLFVISKTNTTGDWAEHSPVGELLVKSFVICIIQEYVAI